MRGASTVCSLGVWWGLSLLSSSAHALVTNWGGVEAQWDTQLSFETAWAMENPRRSWIGAANGGSGAPNQSSDDGRLNFSGGTVFSKRLEWLQALELRREDSGLFLQGRAWHDWALADEALAHRDVSSSNRPAAAQSSGAQWLEAFAYHHYRLGDQSGVLRLGRQRVRWGESQLIDSPLNAINPRDGRAVSEPDAAPSETALPVPLLYLSQSLNSSWAVDAFYQLAWEPDAQANCGTFFSRSDALPHGCHHYDVGLAYTQTARTLMQDVAARYGQGYQYTAEGVRIPHGHDQEAQDTGQWGLAVHRYGPHWTAGLYALNYHSRQAMMGTRTANAATQAALNDILAATPEALQAPQRQALLLGNSRYFLRYPEHLRIYGLRFSQDLTAGRHWFTEWTYQPNAPLAINQAVLIQALATATEANQVDSGYRRKSIVQGQLGFEQALNALGQAEDARLRVEAAYVRVLNLGQGHYGRDPVLGLAGHRGFVTSESWHYQARWDAEYAGFWPQTRLHPYLIFRQDLKGYGPNGSSYEGARAATLGLTLHYWDNYRLTLSYNYFGGGGRYNPWADRDFMKLEASARF